MATAAQAVDRFSPEQQQLSPVERTALEHIRECIRSELQLTQVSLTLAIGSQNMTGGTAAGVLKRLEDKGYITRTFYQRGVQACDAETGLCTPPPTCRAVHWRQRKESVPTPPLHAARASAPNMAKLIEAEARRAGIPLPDFLMDLVYNGMELWLDKQENENE